MNYFKILRKAFLLGAFISILWKPAQAGNLKAYYTNINEAELAVIHHDYKSAAQYYNKAFKNKKEPFTVDYYNASLCFIKTDRLNKAMDICFKLANKAVGKEFFLKKIYAPLKKNSRWPALLKEAQIKKEETDGKNKNLENRLSELFHSDQQAHILLRTMTNKTQDSIIRYVDNVDSTLDKQLLRIFNENGGVLTEFDLGAFLNKENSIRNIPNFYIIILHNFESESLKQHNSPFESLLKKAVLDGKMRPVVYAEMLDFYGSLKKFYGIEATYWKIDDSLYILKSLVDSPSLLRAINERRKNIMLPSLNDYIQKVWFNFKEPNSDFKIFGTYSIIGSFEAPKDRQYFLRNIVPLEGTFIKRSNHKQ